jgi:hypothetical protein
MSAEAHFSLTVLLSKMRVPIKAERKLLTGSYIIMDKSYKDFCSGNNQLICALFVQKCKTKQLLVADTRSNRTDASNPCPTNESQLLCQNYVFVYCVNGRNVTLKRMIFHAEKNLVHHHPLVPFPHRSHSTPPIR